MAKPSAPRVEALLVVFSLPIYKAMSVYEIPENLN